MNITLYRAFPDPYRRSMSLYADRLLENFKKVASADDRIEGYLPAFVALKPKWARYLSQYLYYPLGAGLHREGVHHMIDHAYGHLCHVLPACKTIVTFHDAIGFAPRSKTKRAALKRMNCIQRHNLEGMRKAAKIICVSEASRQALLKCADYPVAKTVVIHQGADDVFFQETTKDPYESLGLNREDYILHIGHNDEYKNIQGVFEVLRILKNSGRKVRLLKVGMPFTPEQTKQVQLMQIEDRITHAGMIPWEDRPLAYRAAKVLLFPSLNEGFGLPVIEAMASGTPVVSTTRGAVPEVAGSAALLFDPDNYAAMAHAVGQILDRAPLVAPLIKAGHERAKQFTWRETAKKTYEVYREVAGE